MRRLGLSLLASGALAASVVTAPLPAAAQNPLDVAGAVAAGAVAAAVGAPYMFGGRNYCFYPGGWHGPGWYWCGYAYRTGYGWGGGEGWHGWRAGGGGRPLRGGPGGHPGPHPVAARGAAHPPAGHPAGGEHPEHR